MGMTLTEKILANKSGNSSIKPGDLIFVKVDLSMATDIASPLTIKVFEEIGMDKVFDPDKIALVNDHLTPAKDIDAAGFSKMMREFAKKHGIKHYYEVGRTGISHVLLPDEGLIAPGDIILGADSHSTTYGAFGCFGAGMGATDIAAIWAEGEIWLRVPETIKIEFKGKLPKYVIGKDLVLLVCRDLGMEGGNYKALEYCGETVDNMTMDDRLTLTNMAIEAGAKNGVIAADDTTMKYLEGKLKKDDYQIFESDDDAEYHSVLEYDVTDMEPQVAVPFLPSNVKPISQVENVKVDQVMIGSCTNGRYSDFELAAEVLGDNKFSKDTRVLITPATTEIYQKMLKSGLILKFSEAGAAITTPGCGACIGAHLGVMGDKEVGVFTTNRNFPGRTGARTAEVYLSNPAVAAASGITGRLTDPRELS
ncbi:MAG: 3-isopropylmalate dehydratase large subunit [Candidatus Marinimicrobia bacterium]|nr:3-isopropylmalate dehydratase large subunit [Candidatus Neomarinimicrobiota bacterium]